MTGEKQNYWIQSGIFSFLEKGSMLLFGFGSFFLLVRVLSKEDFGTWVLFLTITTIIEVGRAGLLQNAVVKFLVEYPANAIQIKSSGLWINLIYNILVVGLLNGLVFELSEVWETPVLPTLIQIYSITTLFHLILQHGNSLHHAYLNFQGIFWSNFCLKGIFFFSILCLFLNPELDVNLTYLALFQLVATIIGAIVSVWLGRHYWSRSWKWSGRWVLTLLQYGKYVMGTNLSAMLYKTIDKMMLGGLMSINSVAFYETAIRVINLTDVPTQSMAAIVFPKSAQEKHQNGHKDLYEKSVGAILVFVLPAILTVTLFPKWMLWIIAGSEYVEGASILRMAIWYAFFVPFAIQFGTILDASGRPHINFWMTFFGAMINVAMNYLFINQYGIEGAVYGTLLTYLITFVVMQQILKSYFKVSIRQVFVYSGFYYKSIWRLFSRQIFLNPENNHKPKK